MKRLEMEERYGHMCDCRIWDDPVEDLCPFCRRRREDIEAQREEEDNEADVHKD